MTEKENEDRPDSYFAILEAAVQEFSERGYAGVRMEHVAKRAGFNKSLVYRFFGNKDVLFKQALSSQFKRRNELLSELPAKFEDILSCLKRNNWT